MTDNVLDACSVRPRLDEHAKIALGKQCEVGAMTWRDYWQVGCLVTGPPHWALSTGPKPWSTGPPLGLATGPPMGLATDAPMGPGHRSPLGPCKHLSRAMFWFFFRTISQPFGLTTRNPRNPTGPMMKTRPKFPSSLPQYLQRLVPQYRHFLLQLQVCRSALWLAP